jgi:3-dehydroquinate dehydratase/shikimate dehydrogenase
MICVSVMQESRKLALVDMLNAAPQCDLIELRLDKFEKAPDIKELLGQKRKPILVSCRRPKDGGYWSGSEAERLALLRQCIIDKADYVEIEHDVADQIRPFPGSQRVISYTNMQGVPENLGDLWDQMRQHHPDVIKLTTLARTPEEAWPLVQIAARAATPTVIVGLGKPGIMLTVLGKKVGAPWAYAALERGLEAYPGQVTVADLNDIYRYPEIQKNTRLIGVTGFGQREVALLAMLNAGLAAAGLPARCLPLGLGSLGTFRKVMEAVKLAGVALEETAGVDAAALASTREAAAEGTGAVDFLISKEDKTWMGHHLFVRAALTALEEALASKAGTAEKPLNGRVVLIIGANASARAAAFGVRKRGGMPILAARDKELAQHLAGQFKCRFVPFEAIYSTTHDVLVVTSEESRGKSGEAAGLHPGLLRVGSVVLDVTHMPRWSPLALEAQARGCTVVSPRKVLLAVAASAIQVLTGQPADQAVLTAALERASGAAEEPS